MEIPCPNCLLRPLSVTDAATLAEHANDREVWLNLRDRFPHPYTVRDAETFIASLSGHVRTTIFGIVVNGEAVGTIGLEPREDIERHSAEIGYWLGRRLWGRGLATEAVCAITGYAFSELEMHRVFAVPFVHNLASCRVLEKAGYALEGRMRRSAVKAGQVLDQWLYAAYDDSCSRLIDCQT